MPNNTITIPEEIITAIVRCLEDSVGDDILTDIQKNGLITMNSIPSRIWDILNTSLISALNVKNCSLVTTKRGPWEMLIIYEKTSQCIITFMREKRFAEIKKKTAKRKHMHYLDAFAKNFNWDLISKQQNFGFTPHEFVDESKLDELVQELLQDLQEDVSVVRHHVLVLFDTAGYQLTHVRAVMVTPSLEIAQGCEQDWSKYLSINESVVVEKVSNPAAPENQPTQGLTVKAKALARQKVVTQLKDRDAIRSSQNSK